MRKIVLYAHGGSGNHGCEAIVRATLGMLPAREPVLLSANPEQDRHYGLEELVKPVPETGEISRCGPAFWRAYAALKLRKDFLPMERLRYRAAFDRISPGDLAVSIGGDNYCYADAWRYSMLHAMARSRGAETVLWGCSVEPELGKDPVFRRDFAAYDRIFARESISYETLMAVNPNTVLAADPAFCLPAAQTPLPEGFVPGHTVGINISPLVLEREAIPGMVFENAVRLVAHILEHTDLRVALIPHVVQRGNDDRIPLRQLYDRFCATGRVIPVPDRGCMELKHLIAQCRFLVAARTHASIAAYSTGVPTLVLGYSVKSQGIARDLFGSERGLVLAVRELLRPEELTHGFAELTEREGELRSRLKTRLPEYIQTAKIAGKGLMGG